MITTKRVMSSKGSAVFLDRDGIINKEVSYCHRKEEFNFVPNIFKVIFELQKQFDYIFIVTNQAGIGRGYYSEGQYAELTSWMLEQFEKENIYITKVYHCPHHPSGIAPYNIECCCRKPKPGMLLTAMKEFSVDPAKSILLGDKISDIESAREAKLAKAYIFGTGHLVSSDDISKADMYFESMIDFYAYIRSNSPFQTNKS
ncbi:D-glycero-alpha-D-manno-heptose-1,7-bisphosphate 7-phosphatase [Yersinia enterocolitica]|nr:HAD family hydrolase [Yersinia enterocolitica]HBN1876911.1 HAD family hydrolase [Escherichia coli]EKN4145340.1 HAD family hydrolase [Yersinia enterocolitica]EMC5228739.1 HAD family hydrolase [Yersinia enterocolitica]HDL7331491.1 HAD family hydrolase [Yersinia enterocolitica]